MTHSLHRQGKPAELENDYVILITPAAGINHQGTARKLKEILDYIEMLGPSNIGGYETGSIHAGYTFEQIRSGLDRAKVPRVRCCFSDFEKIRRLVEFIKQKDYGISVTVSGLTENIQDMCKDLQIRPHSINLSLGFHGRTDLLPDEEVLKMVTMCGHGMVGAGLVRELMKEVRAGRMKPEDAAREVSKPCVCGIFNTRRAQGFFESLAP